MIRTETVFLEGEGERIEGLLCLPEEEKDSYPTVVAAHGFGGNYHFLTGNIAKRFAENGFAAFAFNFRNPDTRCMLNTTVLTEAKTLNIVLDRIRDLPFVDPDRLFLLGESQGGFVSAYVSARREDIRRVILFYPAFVLQDDAKRRNPDYARPGYVYPETEVIGNNTVSGIYSEAALSFDIYDTIRAYHNPVLIVHGTADPVVPLSYSEKAVETYANAKLEIIEGAGHGFYWGEPFDVSMRYAVSFLKEEIAPL